jgi:hypothetical protein
MKKLMLYVVLMFAFMLSISVFATPKITEKSSFSKFVKADAEKVEKVSFDCALINQSDHYLKVRNTLTFNETGKTNLIEKISFGTMEDRHFIGKV